MTVAVPGGEYDYSAYMGVGTEDVDATDFGIARWKINHNKGLFVNNQNDVALPELNVIVLNNVKQRVMFNPDINDEETDPWCKSNDHKDGYPGENFPWENYAFNNPELGNAIPLPCSSCNFAQWGERNPKTGKAKKPLCAELFTFTMMMLDEELEGTPGILSLKGTSIGPAKKFMAPFVQRRQPMFIKTVRISLTEQLFQGRVFYVAKFDITGDSEPSSYPEFANIAMNAREYLTAPPRAAEDEVPDEIASMARAEIEVSHAEPAAESVAALQANRPANPAPAQRPTAGISKPAAPPSIPQANPTQARVRPHVSEAPEVVEAEVVSEAPVAVADDTYDDLPF